MNILIVDDDLFNRTLLSDILSPFGSCDTAADGIEAIDLFENAHRAGTPYNLVCLDIIMPDMDGRQVLKRIRDFEERNGADSSATAKVVMVTSESDVDSILTSYNSKCDIHITKPIVRDVIIEKLRYLGLI